MKIALLSRESLHSVHFGDAAVHTSQLAAALQRRGHETHVFTALREGQEPYALVDGVHYHRCPVPLDPDFVTEAENMGMSFVHHLGETEEFQHQPFDIVHGHDWLTTKGVVQAKNDRGRPTVMTIHSTEFGRCGSATKNGNCARVRADEREGTYVADRVITISSVVADEVKWQYEVPEWKLRVVPEGIVCARFEGEIDAAACRAELGIEIPDPMILFVGDLSARKGPDLLLDAVPGILERRPDAKIVFLGDGDMREALEQAAQEKDVEHAVRFIGEAECEEQITRLLKTTDLVCVPSRNEPFGTGVLEAWAAGKPVIATRCSGSRDIITHGEDGLLVNDDPFAICTAVWDVLADGDWAHAMGECGRRKAEERFNWDAVAEQTEAIYAEIT